MSATTEQIEGMATMSCSWCKEACCEGDDENPFRFRRNMGQNDVIHEQCEDVEFGVVYGDDCA